jgi:uncharacterized protein
MGAIAVHHTKTTDEPWDGPAAKANLKLDGSESYYRSAFAWQDPDGDATKKASYKFIHHEVASDGTVGAANLTACSSGIAVLNGGRGGADIPDGDRKGVHAHLAGHLKDAGKEAPELKSAVSPKLERRAFVGDLHVEKRGKRVGDSEGDSSGADQDAMPMIKGHAAVFDQKSELLGSWMPFREKVAKGAFGETIAQDDIRALWNHDPNHVLGRNKSGTLRLKEDSTGLAVEIDPPDAQWARDLVASIERGDVSQMSFGFDCLTDSWSMEDGADCRTLGKVKLYDVSPVTFPAYPQTDVATRSLDDIAAEGRRRLAPSMDQLEADRRRIELMAREV